MINYRVRFVKEKNLKFLSHLDLIKTMERALRRGQLPVAHSEGYNPRPKMSFGPALSLGIASQDEYLDVQLNEDIEPHLVMDALNSSLPDGLKILDVKKIHHHHVKPLNAIINRAAYLVLLNVRAAEQQMLVNCLRSLPGMDEILVSRSVKGEQKVVNIRPWLHNLTIEIQNGETIKIIFTGEIGSGGNLRPDDIINCISLPVQVVSVTRIGLWHEEKGIVMKPFDFCEKVGD